MRKLWNLRMLDLAAHIAQWSKDPSTQVGALVVDKHRRILGTGYNGFPRNVEDLRGRYEDRKTKYKLVVHAEANAILTAASVTSIAGCTLVSTLFPCTECTKLIIQSGIRKVLIPTDAEIAANQRWEENFKWSGLMLEEAGVAVHSEEP